MINIVVPMAGRGSRFSQAGYSIPKPLLSVFGRPMIEVVIENLRPSQPHRFIFICQREHLLAHDLEPILREAGMNTLIVPIDHITEGAACTVLLAEADINNDDALMIANCDQYIATPIDSYLNRMEEGRFDGFIMTMTANDPKWSFIGLDADGKVNRVVEKQVVSDEATVGVYNYLRGRDFVAAAHEMIASNDRTNNEFYVAPAYNYMIRRGSRVGHMNIGADRSGMYGLGTPTDLEYFNSLKSMPARENTMKIIECIACKNSNTALYYQPGQYSIYKCKKCGFGFVTPRPTEEQLIDFYNSTLSFNYTPPKLSKKHAINLVKDISETIKKFRPDAKNLLDVGCAYGHELYGYKSLGFEVAGMDYSKFAAKYGAENYNLRIDIGEWPEDNRRFDVITSRHVIEHIRDLDSYAKNLHNRLSDRGVAYIITPNFNSLNSLIFKKFWSAVTPPGHLNYWTSKSIEIFFERKGFKVLSFKTTSLSYVQTPAKGIPGFWIGFVESMVNLLRARRRTEVTPNLPIENVKLQAVNAAQSTGATLPDGKLYWIKKFGYLIAWGGNLVTFPLQIMLEKLFPIGEELHIFIARKN